MADAMTAAQVILEHSKTHSLFDGAPGCTTYSATWSSVADGIEIHQVGPARADYIGRKFLWTSIALDVPLTGALAWSAEESIFDEKCRNKNWGKNADGTLRSNEPAHNDADDDLGIFELKAGLLIHRAPGVIDLKSAEAFCYSVDHAIPYGLGLYSSHIAWAEATIAQEWFRGSSLIDARFRNKYVLATGAFNFGRMGVLAKWVTTGKFPPHCIGVIRYEQKFAGWMHLPTIHPGLSLDEGRVA